MANDIGTQKSFNGSSMALNTQKGGGGQKPSCEGNHNPGGTKPMPIKEGPVPMPK
jgi:hypothetical protein